MGWKAHHAFHLLVYLSVDVCRLVKIKEYVDEHDPGAVIIPFSADFELRFVAMSEEEKAAFAEANPGVHSQLSRIIQVGYKALQLIYFFTAGKDEVKAWTIQVSYSLKYF